MSLTDYNAVLNSQGKESSISELGDAECVVVKYRPDPENSDVDVYKRQKQMFKPTPYKGCWYQADCQSKQVSG